MLYAARDQNGHIVELHPMPAGNAREELPNDDPEALRFIHERWRQNELNRLDGDFVRVIEDMLELLMKKEIILFTDLPEMVQQKFLRRREIRQQGLFSDAYRNGDDDIIPL